MLKITVEKVIEPVFASVPLKSTYILAFVVATGHNCFSSSVGFCPRGKIIFRSLPASRGFSSSSRVRGMLLILIPRDFLILFLISCIPWSIS